MGKGLGWARLCLMGLCLFAVFVPSWAQNSPEDEYKDLIRVDQDIQPLGAHPFGANISLYDGGLSFNHVDVSLAGNGPLLKLVRTFKVQGWHSLNTTGENGSFADWSLALPRLETMTIRHGEIAFKDGFSEAEGWQVAVADSANLDKRCTYFNSPPDVVMQAGDSALTPWTSDQWWKGYHMVIPGQGSHDLLGNTDSQTKGTYPVVTKNHWRFSCLSSVANASSQQDVNGYVLNTTGEGFLGIAPDGTKYWFNELVYRDAPSMSRKLFDAGLGQAHPRDDTLKSWFESHRAHLGHLLAWLSGSPDAMAVPASNVITRTQASLLVTKIEDRFGNTLVYSYNSKGYLTAITASDGRKLTVQYESGSSSQIKSVTLQPAAGTPRVWTYVYSSDNTTLIAVTLPNGHQWHYDFASFDNMRIDPGTSSSCSTLGPDTVTQSAVTGSMTHPSGLKGTFTVKPIRHGQWWGNPTDPDFRATGCIGEQYRDPSTGGSYVTIPYAWYSFTTTQKVLSGAGLPGTETWKFSYQKSTQTWTDHTCTGSCKATTWTKVENPDGSTTQYTFSNKFDYSESHLLRTDYYASSATGTPLRSVTNAYAPPDTASLPARAGDPMQWLNVNVAQISKYSPLQTRTIHQDGDTYTWKAEAFNTYAQVTKTKRFNSIAGQAAVEAATTYRNDTTHWVLGLPLKQTNLTTGDVVSQYFYNSDDLLTSRNRFGQKVMSYTWNSVGQLTGFTDADGHTTTLGSYERGIPQTIGYPDNTSQHLIVNDFGEITSITNQGGHTTHYAYDAEGRLTKITYPSDGAMTWYPKTFQYKYIVGTERGIGGGHWRRTVSQGAARHVTWYDALLRPILTDTYITGVDSSDHNVRTTYNWRGQPTYVSTVRPGWVNIDSITGAGTTKTFDALGRVIKVSQPSDLGTLTSTTTYLSGARKRVTDPAGHVTTTSYQVFDQPSYKKTIKVQAPDGITQLIARDLYGKPTTFTQSGPDGQGGMVSVTKHLYYNAQQRLCRAEEPETGSTLMGYDAAGNLVWSTEGQSVSGSGCGSASTASRTTRSYDAMNRLVAVNYPDGQGNVTTDYDAMGQIRSAKAFTASGAVLWTYAYDTLGHLTSETLQMDGYTWPIHYAYAANAALSKITYPNGKSVAYAPDALGRPTQAGTYATGASYFPDGALEHFVFGNGSDYLTEKNTRNLLSNLTYANGNTLEISQDYTYDKDANLTSINDLVGQNDKVLSYDALNRLATAKAAALWGTVTYGYDALNNLRQLTRNSDSQLYHYGASNRLTSITDGSATVDTFAYDPQGNITQKNSQSRVFDAAHRLLHIPGEATYAYDAAGRRVKTTHASGDATYSVYNRAGHLMVQWNKATNTTTDYVYLGKKLIAEVATSPLPPASAPSLTVPTADSDGNYSVAWGGVNGATRYILQENDGGSWSEIYTGSGASQTITGKGNGSYGYRVQACNDAGCSSWSTTRTVTVTHSPGSAPSLSVPTSNHTGSYTVSWSTVGTAISYTLQERKNSGSWSTAYSGSSRSKTISGKGNGSYGYRVQACNAGGCGNWSAMKSVTVLLPPPVPASFSVPSTDNNGSYTVSWGAASTATSYTLQERKNNGSWSMAYSGSNRSKAISGKGNGSYGYHVRACNSGGCGSWSTTRTVVVTHPPASAPSLSAPTSDNNGYFTVSWGSVSTATSYTLQGHRSGGSWSTVYSGGSRSKYLRNLADGTYYYRVRACTVGGCGPWSGTKTVKVARPPTSAPSLSVPSSNHDGSYTVSWGSVSRATSYTLQERKNSGSWGTIYNGGSRSKARSGRTDGRYGYRVRACNLGGCGLRSTTHTVSVVIIPSAPSAYINTYGNYKRNYQELAWDAVSHASRYEVKTSSSSTIHNVGTDTSYLLRSYRTPVPIGSTRPPLTGYVRACNSNGCSAWDSATAY